MIKIQKPGKGCRSYFHLLFLIVPVLLIGSCSHNKSQSTYYSNIDSSSGPKFSIVFSNNINGETHPCGCRHFPLGGLPQVAGLLHQLRKEGPVIYVDSGDAFFSLPAIPPGIKKSTSYNAKKLANALAALELKFFLPGDQDFALGEKFLAGISKKVPYTFLISNLSPASKIKHRPWHRINVGPYRIYLLGIIGPQTLREDKDKKLFLSAEAGLARVLEKITQDGYDKKNSKHRLIVLSHSGINEDEELARKFPFIDWIIGAHTQDFLREAIKVGKTRVVQGLSRNHYVGQIFPLRDPDKEGTYKLWEVRDELVANLKPNPFSAFIDKHKESLAKIQKEEQNDMTDSSFSANGKKFPSPVSCLECHQQEVRHWKKTPHALAYATLLRVKEENNLQCIGCHSLGLNDPRGFSKVNELVSFTNAKDEDKQREGYWKHLKAQMATLKAVRQLSPDKLRKWSDTWQSANEHFGVKDNFANVQCLNCHQQPVDHPFNASNTVRTSAEDTQEKKLEKMSQQCLKCHTADQSPEWYHKDDHGLPQKINELVLIKMIKSMAHTKK